MLKLKLLVLLVVFMMVNQLLAQPYIDAIHFKSFKSWIHKCKVADYKFSQVEIDGNAEEGKQSYIAAYKKGKILLAISYSSEKEYFSYVKVAGTNSQNVYELNGYHVVYYPVLNALGSAAVLCVWLPELKASFSISVSQMLLKNEIENILTSFDLSFFDKHRLSAVSEPISTAKDTIIVKKTEPVLYEAPAGNWGTGERKSKLLEHKQDTVKTPSNVLWWY